MEVPCKWHKNIDLFVVRIAYMRVCKDYMQRSPGTQIEGKKRDCVHISTLLNIVVHVRFTTTLIINLFDKGTWRPYSNFSIHQKLSANHSMHIYFQLYILAHIDIYFTLRIILLLLFLLSSYYLYVLYVTWCERVFLNHSQIIWNVESDSKCAVENTCPNSSIFFKNFHQYSRYVRLIEYVIFNSGSDFANIKLKCQ